MPSGLEGAARHEEIGRGLRIEQVRAQLAETLRVDGEREEQQEEDDLHGESSIHKVA